MIKLSTRYLIATFSAAVAVGGFAGLHEASNEGRNISIPPATSGQSYQEALAKKKTNNDLQNDFLAVEIAGTVAMAASLMGPHTKKQQPTLD